MSRTDELKKDGAKSVGGGVEYPFVRWPDGGTAYVEGEVIEYWESSYGGVFTVQTQDVNEGLEASLGEGEPRTLVQPGQTVNVGLQYSVLKGFDDRYEGATLHIAFEGWKESKYGNEYRVFNVFDLTEETPEGGSGEARRSRSEPEGQSEGVGPGAPDAEQPPITEPDDLTF